MGSTLPLWQGLFSVVRERPFDPTSFICIHTRPRRGEEFCVKSLVLPLSLRVSVPARIGELVQGCFREGEPFMVPGPLSSRMAATLTLRSGKGGSFFPRSGLWKMERAADFFFLHNKGGEQKREERDVRFPIAGREEELCRARSRRHEALEGLALRRITTIPQGKGFSSSSADLLALLRLLQLRFSPSLSTESLYRMAASVEPTDPCLTEGTPLFLQNRGEAIAFLRALEYDLLYFDPLPGGRVSTLELNRNSSPSSGEDLLRELERAFAQGSYSLFCETVTESARRNQSRLPDPHFSRLVAFARSSGTGVFTAHSGTVMGLVAEPGREPTLAKEAARFVRSLWGVPLERESSRVSAAERALFAGGMEREEAVW